MFVQAFIGPRHVVPQALLGQGLKLRLAAVDLPSWVSRLFGDVAFSFLRSLVK